MRGFEQTTNTNKTNSSSVNNQSITNDNNNKTVTKEDRPKRGDNSL